MAEVLCRSQLTDFLIVPFSSILSTTLCYGTVHMCLYFGEQFH